MIYDIYNITATLAEKYWSVWPITFKVWSSALSNPHTFASVTLQDRWDYAKKKRDIQNRGMSIFDKKIVWNFEPLFGSYITDDIMDSKCI